MSVLEHVFSIEIESKRFVKNLVLSDETHETVLFEGTLGESNDISIEEGDVLEIAGRHGTIRISITQDQMLMALKEHGLTLKRRKMK